MTSLVVPWDEQAERTVIGCALATPAGARLARARLSPDDFYRPAHAWLFAVLDRVDHLDASEERARSAAGLAGVDCSLAEQLVEERAVMWDRSGSYAARVAATARARLVMHQASDVVNRLGSGDRLEDLGDALRTLGAAVC